MVVRNSNGKRRFKSAKPTSVVLPAVSPKQYKVLKAYQQLQRKHGYTPSYEEVCAHLGLRALATIQKHLVNLEEKRLLTKTWNHNRSVVITELGLTLLSNSEVA